MHDMGRALGMDEGEPEEELCDHLHNGGDEFQEKAWELQQAGVEVVEEVHDEPFDVGPIMILICHDHEVAIPQLLDALIQLHNLQKSRPTYCCLQVTRSMSREDTV